MSLLQQTIAGLSKNAFSGSHLPFFNCYKDKYEHCVSCSLVQVVGVNRDVPLTPYFHLTDGNLTKDTYNILRRL